MDDFLEHCGFMVLVGGILFGTLLQSLPADTFERPPWLLVAVSIGMMVLGLVMLVAGSEWDAIKKWWNGDKGRRNG